MKYNRISAQQATRQKYFFPISYGQAMMQTMKEAYLPSNQAQHCPLERPSSLATCRGKRIDGTPMGPSTSSKHLNNMAEQQQSTKQCQKNSCSTTDLKTKDVSHSPHIYVPRHTVTSRCFPQGVMPRFLAQPLLEETLPTPRNHSQHLLPTFQLQTASSPSTGFLHRLNNHHQGGGDGDGAHAHEHGPSSHRKSCGRSCAHGA